MLVNSLSSVCIWSQNYKKLAKWYQETLELKVDKVLTLPDDTGITFMINEVYFWVGYHDKITGKNKDKYRIMVGFDVDSVGKLYKKLIKKKVKFIQKPRLSPTKDYYVSTALDPEDNIIEFFSDNP